MSIYRLMVLLVSLLLTNSGWAVDVKAGTDFFRDEMGNQLDYSDSADRRYEGVDDINMTGASVTGGNYVFTTSGTDCQIQLLNASIPSSVPLAISGDHFPIDTSKYYILTMKITCPDAPNVDLFEVSPADGIQANIQWYKDKQQASENSTTAPFFIYPGTHIYKFDLRSITLASSNGGTWTGEIKGLRFDPSNLTGYDFSIDWVTLSDESSAVASLDWATVPTISGIGLSTDNNISNLIQFLSTTAAVEARYQMLPEGQTSGALASVDVSYLAPGTYYLHPLDSGGNPIATSAQTLVVNAPPSINIIQPDAQGDESKDFALTFRDSDAWDFSQSGDFSTEELQDNEYGQGTVVSSPSTDTAGTLSGDWLYHTNSGVVKPEDPNFRLTHVSPIDTSVYKNITIKILLDRERDIGEGSVMRVFWSELQIVDDLTKLHTSEDIIVQNGVNEITLDLDDVPMEADDDGTGRTPWPNIPLAKFIRIDPHEFPSVTKTYIDSVVLTPHDQVDSDGLYNFTWTGTDEDDADNSLTVTIKLDTDKNRFNANETTIVTGTANDGTHQFTKSDFPGLSDGVYYVLYEISDGVNTQSLYAGGKLNTALPTSSTATLTTTQVGEGTVTPAIGNHGLILNSAQAITGYPDTASGYDFVNWTVTSGTGTIADSTAEATTVTMLGDTTISANFAIRQPIYRVYSSGLDYHFFCRSFAEYQNAVNVHLYNDESNGGSSPPYYILASELGGAVGMHRLFNPNAGRHFYTTNTAEKDFLVSIGWNYEGIEAYMFSSEEVGSQEVFKLYNPNSGVHLYTINSAEKDFILANFTGWEQHSSLGYAYPTAGSSGNAN